MDSQKIGITSIKKTAPNIGTVLHFLSFEYLLQLGFRTGVATLPGEEKNDQPDNYSYTHNQ